MTIRLLTGDCRALLADLPAESVQCVVTSPPYWGLRSYLPDDDPAKALEIGSEESVAAWVETMVEVFRGVWRVLRPDGTCWVNCGDTYSGNRGPRSASGKHAQCRVAVPAKQPNRSPQPGLKHKDMVGLPWRLAFALQADGWWLRSDVIWHKTNPMPGSQTDRPTSAHEHVFLLSRAAQYYYDAEAVRVPVSGTAHPRSTNVQPKCEPPGPVGNRRKNNESFSRATAGLVDKRNLRDVWSIPTFKCPEAHFATFPPALVVPCVRAGTSEKGCCAACRAPWVREVEVTYDAGNSTTNGPRNKDNSDFSPGFDVRKTRSSKTTGWRPGCDCDDGDPVPCTVLDPFSGAGTTGLVCSRLGRDFVGLELNADYNRMAADRIRADAPLLTTVEVVQQKGVKDAEVQKEASDHRGGARQPTPHN